MVRAMRQVRLNEEDDRILAAEMADRRARYSADMWKKERERLMDELRATPMKVETEVGR
jgi:hypothetical protein